MNFGVTGVGTASYIDSKMLSDLFGVHVRQVTGYPGSTEKRIAIERGELDGDCIGWTSVPEQWVRDKKVTVHLRFSPQAGRRHAGDVAGGARRSDRSDGKRQVLDLLTASSVVGRPYIVPKAVPADRYAALRTAFEATLKDPEFVAEIAKQRLTIAPMTGAGDRDVPEGALQDAGAMSSRRHGRFPATEPPRFSTRVLDVVFVPLNTIRAATHAVCRAATRVVSIGESAHAGWIGSKVAAAALASRCCAAPPAAAQGVADFYRGKTVQLVIPTQHGRLGRRSTASWWPTISGATSPAIRRSS